MKGQLTITFEMGAQGKSVSVSGQTRLPNGHLADLTADVLFCLGLLDYARGILWLREQQALTAKAEPAIEVPLGVDARALRAREKV